MGRFYFIWRRIKIMAREKRSSEGTLVMKFGGTSVGSIDAMIRATQIASKAKAEWKHVIIVTSALSGVTNHLLDSAIQAAQGQVQDLPDTEKILHETHFSIADALIRDPSSCKEVKAEISGLITIFAALCRAIATLGEATPRALDAVASMGERMSGRLLSAAFKADGIPADFVEATDLIITNRDFQNAHPDFEATTRCTRRRLEPLLAKGDIPVVTGFIGATPEGVVTTLGRGGSDYSAAILGAVLPADEVWIWTDVDGVMTADPRLVSEARTLEEITYSEMAELAYFGAKVVHPKTVRPLIDAGIRLRICNTFNPDHPGTRLVANGNDPQKKQERDEVVKAVTAIRTQKLVTIEGRGMLGVPGVAARTFAAVASTGTSVPLITQASSEQSICFAVPSASASAVIAALENVFGRELQEKDIDRVWATDEVTIVTVVGAGMSHTPGVAGRIFSQLGSQNINVLAIAQGSSEVSISLVIDAASTEAAVKTLHDLIVR
jgi:bifunctional aspartokinase / homoserine dehydrogenase 1